MYMQWSTNNACKGALTVDQIECGFYTEAAV